MENSRVKLWRSDCPSAWYHCSISHFLCNYIYIYTAVYVYLMCLLLQGYVKRQAVFACNTCTPSAAEPAGICLACANKCHDGHDIFELYTKRWFVQLHFVLCWQWTDDKANCGFEFVWSKSFSWFPHLPIFSYVDISAVIVEIASLANSSAN